MNDGELILTMRSLELWLGETFGPLGRALGWSLKAVTVTLAWVLLVAILMWAVWGSIAVMGWVAHTVDCCSTRGLGAGFVAFFGNAVLSGLAFYFLKTALYVNNEDRNVYGSAKFSKGRDDAANGGLK